MFSRNFVKGLQVARTSLRTYSSEGSAKSVLTGERGVNKVTLVGRAGKDAEMRGSETHPVSIFPLATSMSVKMADGTYKQLTDWHRVSVFRPVVRDYAVQHVKKGNKVYVSGKLSYSDFVDKNNATQRSCTIIADEVITFSDFNRNKEPNKDEDTSEDMPL